MILKTVKFSEYKKMERLLQLYLHELSFFVDLALDDAFNYNYPYLTNYFNEENRKILFVENDTNIIGFVMLEIGKTNFIHELFILNKYRKTGIGEKVVFALFDEYKGNWDIKVVPNSVLAEKFWTKGISEYTSNFNLEYIGTYNRAHFTFSNI